MDGIILIDKPTGLTSHQVVDIVRRQFKLKKVGHAGTLDPLATGLLVIMVGKATKLSNLLTSQFKSYEVEMKLFIKTDTGDVMGKVIETEKAQVLEKKQVQATIQNFNNYSYWQTPPLYSAIKIKGRKLYEYARKGLKIEIPLRWVEIKSTNLIEYDPVKNTVKLKVECSKGTYVRSLVEDIAKKLGTITTVSQLRRISSGKFHIKQALKLEEINPTKIISLNNFELIDYNNN